MAASGFLSVRGIRYYKLFKNMLDKGVHFG